MKADPSADRVTLPVPFIPSAPPNRFRAVESGFGSIGNIPQPDKIGDGVCDAWSITGDVWNTVGV